MTNKRIFKSCNGLSSTTKTSPTIGSARSRTCVATSFATTTATSRMICTILCPSSTIGSILCKPRLRTYWTILCWLCRSSLCDSNILCSTTTSTRFTNDSRISTTTATTFCSYNLSRIPTISRRNCKCCITTRSSACASTRTNGNCMCRA